MFDIKNMDDRYQRAQYLRSGILNNKLHFNDAVFPIWIEGSDCFWYERTTQFNSAGDGRGKEYRLVDAKAGTNELAFDHAVVAKALTEASGEAVDTSCLPIDKVKISQVPLIIDFKAFDRCWQFNSGSNRCVETKTIKNSWSVSPDGKQALFIRDSNLWVHELATGEERALTRDGHQENAYAATATAWGCTIDPTPFPQAQWSPDST